LDNETCLLTIGDEDAEDYLQGLLQLLSRVLPSLVFETWLKDQAIRKRVALS
jgi:hypothetical protein